MPSPYWNSQTAGFQQGIGNIGRALYMRPQLQARNALYRAEAERNAAEIGEVNARTGLYQNQADLTGARVGELAQKGQLVEALQRSSPLAEKAMAEGRFDDPAIDEFTGAASALTGVNKGDIQKSFKQGMGTMLAMRGQTPLAAAVENPVSVQNNRVNADERAARPIALHDDSQLVTPQGGVLATALQKVTPGQRILSPNADDNLTTVGEGSPMPAKSSESEAILNRAIAGVIANKDMDAKTKNGTIAALRAQIGTPAPAATPAVIAAPAPAAVNDVPTVNSQQDYDALPVGAKYRDSAGNVAVKKNKPAQ